MQILSSISYVVSQSRFVFFHPERIGPAVAKWGHLLSPGSFWDHPCHFSDGTEETVRWIFTLDTVNHCFWPDPGDPVWTVYYEGIPYSGYWGLAASLKRAKEMGFPVTDPAYLSEIGEKDLADIFSGEGRIPMFDARLHSLREAGSVILAELGGDIISLFRSASGSAVRLVHGIVSMFPSFHDEAFYRGEKIHFWKRAQLFVSDASLAMAGEKWGRFRDLNGLTAFADYKLPQVMREMEIISYHPDLAARIDAQEYLQPGSEEEIEIRAMTIWAVEEIRKAFQSAGREITGSEVDKWLWELGQLDEFRKRPYHRCRTIFY